MYKLGTYLFNTLFKLSAPNENRKSHRIRNYLGSTFYNWKYFCEKHIEEQKNYLYKEASENKPMEILELSKKDMENKEICKKLTKDFTLPFIVKKYFKNTEPVKNWDLQYLIDNHGEFKVEGLKLDLNLDNPRPGAVHIPLKEFIERILNKEKLYLTVDLDLVEELDLEKLEFDERLKKIFDLSGYHNLFLGGDKSYTPLHSELPASAAVQIIGKKKWYLIDTKYSSSLHSVIGSSGIYYAPAYCFAESRPEAKIWRIPRYEVVCEPGDFLYVPSWVWHETYNMGKENLMICSRPLFNTVHLKNHPTFALSSPIASFVYSKAVMPYVKEYIHKAENVVQSLKKMENRVPLKYVNLKIQSLNRSRLTKNS